MRIASIAVMESLMLMQRVDVYIVSCKVCRSPPISYLGNIRG